MLLSIIISVIISLSPQTDKKEQAKALANRGFLQIESKEYKKAVKSFEKAIKLDKNCKEAHLGKGVAYFKWGDYNPREVYPEEFLKRALKIDPDYLKAKIYLGWSYFWKQDNKQAIKYFKKLLEDEEENGELYFHAGKIFDGLHNYFYEEKKIVPFLLKKSIESGYENPELYYLSGWKYFLKDSINAALYLYEKGLSITKKEMNFQPYIDMGILYFNLNDSLKAEQYFNMAVEKMPAKCKKLFNAYHQKKELRNKVLNGLALKFYTDDNWNLTKAGKRFIDTGEIYYEIGPVSENAFLSILSKDEKEEYLRLNTIPERNNYVKSFFLSKDPTPFDKTNEFEEEFWNRFDYVFKAYRAAPSPYMEYFPMGFDDRGKIYLKYGTPNKIYSPPMSDILCWYYDHLHMYMAFDFYAKGITYILMPSLAGVPSFGRQRINITQDNQGRSAVRGVGRYDFLLQMIDDRAMVLGGIYAMMSMGDRTALSITADLAEFEIYRKELMEERIVTYYPTEHRDKHLNFGYRCCDFRYYGDDALNEIYYGLKLDNLKFEKSEGKYTSSIKFYSRLVNSDFNEIYKDSVETKFLMEKDKKEGIAVNQIRYPVSPGDYTVFVQIKNPESKKTGIYSQNIHIDDYRTEEFSLSGIQFSFNIKKAHPDDKYIKNGLSITPYPFFEVSRSKPLFVYYEIYKLSQNRNGKTSYEITYEIKLLESKESIWRKLFKGRGYKESISISKKETGNKKDTFDYTSFDLSKLRIGKYEIKVKVKDRNSNKSVEKSDTFILVK